MGQRRAVSQPSGIDLRKTAPDALRRYCRRTSAYAWPAYDTSSLVLPRALGEALVEPPDESSSSLE